jgi:hypothetical protein
MDSPNNKIQQKEISWQAPEFAEYRKHPLWFVGFGLVIALLVLFGIYTQSWTTAVLFTLFGLLGVIYASSKPKTVTIKITGSGIQVNSLEYSYRVIKKFWIMYHPPEVKTLYLETNAYLDRIVKIELANQNPNDVRDILKQYLEEDLDQTESVADMIARKIKF